MKNLWDESEAAACKNDLDMRVYTSRLLGREPSLVLHGGGNTSVKINETNILGEQEELLYVKGSGWDLATIEAPGFAPVRMGHMLKLAGLESLSDSQMVNELKTQMTQAGAPSPSVETILHALLPFRFVDHTHADAVVTITNTPGGEERIREIFGDRVVIVPYIMPGFDLARDVGRIFAKEAGENTEGMVLLNHGIFSFSDDPRESYSRMIDLVSLAEEYLKSKNAWNIPLDSTPMPVPARMEIAGLRLEASEACGLPLILTLRNSEKALSFLQLDNLGEISQRGPATPDHVIRTKQKPLLGRDVAGYAKEYRNYFNEHEKSAKDKMSMLDPAPRVVLDPQLGFGALGKTAKDANIVADIYEHTMDCIRRAEVLGGWRALPSQDIFNMEYWELEQAKLRKGGARPLFAGETAFVTGAFSGIGRAVVDSLLKRGAAVVGLDLNPGIETMIKNPAFLGVKTDVTNEADVQKALDSGVSRFGGMDMLILNAGLFPAGCTVAELTLTEWNRVMSVNLDANLLFLRESYPLLKLTLAGGRVVVVGSKNVIAPGPGAAAYSASKAALNQLVRVTALEWGKDAIRLNSLHPNAVFDTGIWTQEVLEARAKHYGLSVEEYKTNNVMGVEVNSRDVAELAAEMCGPLFAKTTASQVPVDGGNERVI